MFPENPAMRRINVRLNLVPVFSVLFAPNPAFTMTTNIIVVIIAPAFQKKLCIYEQNIYLKLQDSEESQRRRTAEEVQQCCGLFG